MAGADQGSLRALPIERGVGRAGLAQSQGLWERGSLLFGSEETLEGFPYCVLVSQRRRALLGSL